MRGGENICIKKKRETRKWYITSTDLLLSNLVDLTGNLPSNYFHLFNFYLSLPQSMEK